MQVICLKEPAFGFLVEQVMARPKKVPGETEEKWIANVKVMQSLNIKSRKTMQKLRNP